jgi:hypothetical protein
VIRRAGYSVEEVEHGKSYIRKRGERCRTNQRLDIKRVRETKREGNEKMKKLMTMTAMLALMLVAAAPAFAQSTAIGGDVDFVDSDQAQFALTQQVNFDNDQDLAGVAQSLEVEQDQSLAAEDSVAAGGSFFGF